MTDSDLHDNLVEIASRVRPADLYQRSLRRSAQLGRRRAGGFTASAVALVLVAIASWQLLPPSPPSVTPQPPAVPDVELTAAVDLDIVADLASATLDFPAWPSSGDSSTCPAGPVTLSSATYRAQGSDHSIDLVDAVRIPLGDQPAYVVNARCIGQGGISDVAQVVAYRRDAGGAYRLMGVVIRTGGEIDGLGALVYPGPDRLGVSVEHVIVPGRSWVEFGTLSTIRVFGWDGKAFGQTGGQTSFLVDESTARVSVAPGRMVVEQAGRPCRTATITLIVTNHGPKQATDVRAVIMSGSTMSTSRSDLCAPLAGQGYQSTMAAIGTVPPDTTKAVTVTMILGEPLQDGGPGWTDDAPENVVALISGDQHWPDLAHYVIDYR